MDLKPSPFAPKSPTKLPAIAGVELAGVQADITYQGRKDLMVIRFAPGTRVAGVFTQNSTIGAPVAWCKQHISGGEARALVVNAGNANVFTGDAGAEIVSNTADLAAQLLDGKSEQVFVASTGVIGAPLDFAPMKSGLEDAIKNLSANGWDDAAHAIMTTDTFAKKATLSTQIGGKTITFNGIAKGSGMIMPNMATMLAFITTDANIDSALLQKALSDVVKTTFNAITVDSDTSTSDTLLTFATGQANIDLIADADTKNFRLFRAALHAICFDLAQQIIGDGEGISKLCEVSVSGANSDAEAKILAMSVANSPLVKTAIAGSDPNWGRIAMALGKTDLTFDMNQITIRICGFDVAAQGKLHPSYVEAEVAKAMQADRVRFEIDMGQGNGNFMVWTSDLTHQYIDINVDYRS